MKKLYGTLAVLCFLCTIGSIGAVEQNVATLAHGTVQTVIFLALFVLFTYLGGGFEYD